MILSGIRSSERGLGQSRLAIEQAIAALRMGDQVEAELTLRRHLLEQPRDSEALAKLAEIAIEQRRMEEAAVLLRRAASADPSPARHIALIRHLQAFGGAAIALRELETLPAPMRGTFAMRAREAALHGQLGQYDRQISLYEALTGEDADNSALWMSYGNALKTVGRAEDAVAAVRRAIDIEPTCGEGYWTLANFKSFRFTDRDVAAMRKALRGKLRPDDRLHFDFALGKAFEDRREFARSFQHYASGNRVRAAAMKPEQMRVTNFVDHAVATYGRDLFDRHSGAGCNERDPIFIVGLQRSGSTLIEQILSCHSMIEGAGELPVIQQIWERIARTAAISARNPFDDIVQWDSAAFGDLGAEYLERTRPFRRTGRPLFIDKLPANWLNAGLIRLALPNARIIDARRHPMACGFSNFKQHYATGVSFAYSLESIGFFYRDYWRFMSHMNRVRPGTVHRVLNERLIEDPEGETKRLLDFLGVPFESACLDFHHSKRAVATPSADQVRRPINRDGVEHWRNFRRWLGPLERALGPALTDWDKQT